MDRPTIALCAVDPARWASRVAEISGAWPDARGVEFVRCELGQGLRLPECAAVLIISADAGDAPRCGAITSAALAQGLGVLILAGEACMWQARAEGAVVLGLEAPAVAVAAALAALCARQEHVDALAGELALAMRCHAGVRHEIERLHEELHLAANVQQEFTSAPMPRIPGCDVASLFRPVSAVSGDIFSVRMIDAHTAGFFIADAVGHGVPAALLTMVLTTTLASGGECAEVMRDPRAVVTRLNRRLTEGPLCGGRFATALYGTLDSRTREVTVCGAGHPHAILLGRGGARVLETDGPLLGVFPDAEFSLASATLGDGESLIVHTDGLDAALPSAIHDGDLRQHVRVLRDALRREGNVRDALAHVEELLDEQSGSLHQGDDITVVAFRGRRRAVAAAA